VFRYAWHLLGRREDAEDATQATFLAVHNALAGGTAVLDSSAWVLRIARNECMGRLRQTARRPAVSLDDGFDPPAAGGVERSAEVRDEMRTASKTLRNLPEPEREAFVMREWLGLEAGEAALALGLTAGDVDGLASRARRSLVLAVGGLEPAIGCSGTRAALETGSLDRAAKVHLLRCPVCRGVRRALRPPDGRARPVVMQRLSAAIPGFASGGGILAALTAKAATAPVLAKTAAIVVAAVAAGGAAEQAIVGAQWTHHGRTHGGKAQVAPAPLPTHSGQALAVQVTPPPTSHAATTSQARPASRGAAATRTDRHGSSGLGSEHGGRSSEGERTGSDDNSGSGKSGEARGDNKGSGHDGEGAATSGKHGSGGDSASSGKGDGNDSGSHSGSGKSSATADGATAQGDSGSGKGSGSDGGDASDSGNGSGSTDGGSDSHGGDDGSTVVTDPAAASSSGGGSD
jgi:RNA polymerase sigma factor (sigma-70 family)